MNAAIRAVVRTACVNGIKVYGVIRGYNGLINGDFIEMDLRSVSDIINRGGTILYSARSVEFATEEGMRKAIRTCQEHGIEGVVVIGGDGSFRGARDLSERGIPCVGLPGTIDNDIACCDNTIGYDTCLNTIMEMVDRVRDTSESHDRCTVVEVMGRKAATLHSMQVLLAVQLQFLFLKSNMIFRSILLSVWKKLKEQVKSTSSSLLPRV
jgi:6-phosphofructokinase 1